MTVKLGIVKMLYQVNITNLEVGVFFVIIPVILVIIMEIAWLVVMTLIIEFKIIHVLAKMDFIIKDKNVLLVDTLLSTVLMKQHLVELKIVIMNFPNLDILVDLVFLVLILVLHVMITILVKLVDGM